MDLTLVTGFFDLNKFEKRPNEKSRENYMAWADYLFKLDMNMVFVVAGEDYNYVWKKRADYNLLHKTFICKKEFSELKFYNLRDELDVYKKEHPIMNSLPNKDSPNYIILTWNKIYFVEEIMKINPFNTNYFGWIDFGIYNVIRDNLPTNIYETLQPTTTKVKIMELRHVFDKETTDMYNYCAYFRWKYAGGLWTGHTSSLTKLISLFKKQLFEILSMRIFAHEETLFALVYKNNKDLFELYYGDYYQILINYNKITNPVNLIFENIKNCRYNRDFKHAVEIAEKLYQDCYDKLSPAKKYMIYDELIVNGFYHDHKKTEHYAIAYLKEIENDTDLKTEFMKDPERNISNLKYFNNSDINKKLEVFER